MPGAIVIVPPGAVTAMLNDPTSGITRDLLVRGDRVKDEAIRIAPVGKPDPLGRARDHAPGNLRDHIVKRFISKGGKPVMLVGVEHVSYALGVHEGTRPHGIDARNAPFLVFVGRDGGIVHTKHVDHPGNRPNRFLVRALRAAAG